MPKKRKKRRTHRAVPLSIRDYARISAPEPDVLRIAGEESKAHGTDKLKSREIDKIIKAARR